MTTTEQDTNPIENGVQQAYIEIREALELVLCNYPVNIIDVRNDLDDAVSNNWDELMAAFWRGVRQDIELDTDSQNVVR